MWSRRRDWVVLLDEWGQKAKTTMVHVVLTLQCTIDSKLIIQMIGKQHIYNDAYLRLLLGVCPLMLELDLSPDDTLPETNDRASTT